MGVKRLEGYSQSMEEKAKRKPLDAEERNLVIQAQKLSNAVACGNTKNFNKVPNELYDPDREISRQTGESANGFPLLPTMKFKERERDKKKRS